MRTAEIIRNTNETQINLSINLDGTGEYMIDTGCGFLNHMLDLFSKHSRIDLKVTCKGDTEVDFHHTAEDIGIALGEAIKEASGNKAGIKRYGHIILPMDESLILAAIDFGGRAYLGFDADIPSPKVGEFDTELVEEFFAAFTRSAELNLHIKKLDGRNSHHIIEGIFKAVARALAIAIEIDPKLDGAIPSTKGVI
ncbi:MAG: imidazoleglycerol-phosphate dehydratase HisB [Clostridia bacterium]|nr:imidazoleglycerol-phosphate dehydratase HisB [Clostridia bacterium]MBQ9920010.1 imidazoleglycerol-phosphate dehydratase HisB [Clostridia bacterium]